MRAGPTALAAAAALVAAGCDRLPLLCRDTLVAGAPSPDGARVADLFVRDCHYTTGYTVHLSLRSAKATRQGPTVATFSGARAPSLAWKSPQRLVVSPDAGSKVLYQKPQWDGVALEYRRPSGDSKLEGTQ